MTGARRRLSRLEAQHGIGQAEWYGLAADGQRAALEAVGAEGGNPADVVRVFDTFRAAYVVGMSEAQRETAADQALGDLKACLPLDAFALTLAHLRFGQA